MSFLTDVAYAIAAGVMLPYWFVRLLATGKLRTDWQARFGRVTPWPRQSGRPRILVHAVSVGETNAIRHLIAALERDPAQPELAVSVSTDTGIARAKSIYGDRHRVVRYPFDVGRAVRRFLDGVQPDLVALTELEVWPNFVAECARRNIPVVIINGRLSDRSEGRYRLARPFLKQSFQSLALVAAQSAIYAARFRWMGVPTDRVRVEGTMKWDTAEIADAVPGADALADAMGIDRARPLVVAGSTAPGEEALLRRSLPEGVQLLVVPRKPEWFDQAARALPGCTRRSAVSVSDGAARQGDSGSRGASRGSDLFLLDAMGQLRQAYALADVVVIGRTFEIGKRYGGSDMMEPVALGKATIVGPDVSNFRETVELLRAADAIVQCAASELGVAMSRLLTDPASRGAMAERGRMVIRREQGASARTAALLIGLLKSTSSGSPSRERAHV